MTRRTGHQVNGLPVLTEGHASNPMSKSNFCKVILFVLKHVVVHVLQKFRPTKSYCRTNLVTADKSKKII